MKNFVPAIGGQFFWAKVRHYVIRKVYTPENDGAVWFEAEDTGVNSIGYFTRDMVESGEFQAEAGPADYPPTGTTICHVAGAVTIANHQKAERVYDASFWESYTGRKSPAKT